MDKAEDPALAFWGGDHLLTTVYEADPHSPLARDAQAIMARSRRSDGLWLAADVLGVCSDLQIGTADLADALGVPFAVGHAVAIGWHRLDLASLADLARRLGVPLAAFVRDSDYKMRARTKLYRDYIRDRPTDFEIPF